MEKAVKKFEVAKCPFSSPVNPHDVVYAQIKEDFELQYNKDHVVEKVKVGETDIQKEIESHVDEVGLVNVMKMAIAHGENPYLKFNKTEDGVPVAVDENVTLDELLELSKKNEEKYGNIAKELGVSPDELVKAINSGKLQDLITAANTKKEVKEGE